MGYSLLRWITVLPSVVLLACLRVCNEPSNWRASSSNDGVTLAAHEGTCLNVGRGSQSGPKRSGSCPGFSSPAGEACAIKVEPGDYEDGAGAEKHITVTRAFARVVREGAAVLLADVLLRGSSGE